MIRNLKKIGLTVLLFSTVLSAADDSVLQEAGVLRLAGEMEKAGELYRQIIQSDSAHADALVGLGYVYLATGKNHEAKELFSRTIAITPDYADAYAGKALALYRDGSASEALKVIDSYTKTVQDDPQGGRYSSEILWGTPFFQQARRLDRIIAPDKNRELVRFPNALTLFWELNILQRDELWNSGALIYNRIVRPDWNVTLNTVFAERADALEWGAGVGLNFRYNHVWSFNYSTDLSPSKTFLAQQRHGFSVHANVTPSTLLQLSSQANRYFDNDNGEWLIFAKAGIEKFVGTFSGAYLFSAGFDKSDELLLSHVVRLSYTSDEKISASAGFSRGYESVEMLLAQYRHDLVETFFMTGRLDFSQRVGVNLSVAVELRRGDYFMTTVSLSPTVRF